MNSLQFQYQASAEFLQGECWPEPGYPYGSNGLEYGLQGIGDDRDLFVNMRDLDQYRVETRDDRLISPMPFSDTASLELERLTSIDSNHQQGRLIRPSNIPRSGCPSTKDTSPYKGWRCTEPSCGKLYARRDTYIRHRATHKDKSHACMTCQSDNKQKVFTRKDHLNEHIRNCHSKGMDARSVGDSRFV